MTNKDTKWISGAKISKAAFYSDYWRKMPLHLSSVLDVKAISTLLTENKLFELSQDELVESRLVNNEDFSLEFGPFNSGSLAKNEMLMVQGLESHFETISRFLSKEFAFLPRWRIDDVMATYANKDTSCGAHFDYYDVFLIQIRGEKRWQLDDGLNDEDDIDDKSDVRLLKNFQAKQELIQKPGDILYIPPKFGHWGIASDDCLTLSVGMRNPTLQEMLSHLADLVGDQLEETQTLDDSLELDYQGIPTSTTQPITQQLVETLSMSELTSSWFGQYMTELKEPDLIQTPSEHKSLDQLEEILWHNDMLQCQLASRLSYQEGEELTVFINGQPFVSHSSVLPWFTILLAEREIKLKLIEKSPENLTLLAFMFNLGALKEPKLSIVLS